MTVLNKTNSNVFIDILLSCLLKATFYVARVHFIRVCVFLHMLAKLQLFRLKSVQKGSLASIVCFHDLRS